MKEYICPDCKRTFDTEYEYRDHRKYPCATIDMMDSKKRAAYTEFEKNTGPHRCPWCLREYSTPQGLSSHIQNKHKLSGFPYDNPNYSFVCKDCKKRFKSADGLAAHFGRAHPEPKTNINFERPSQVQPVIEHIIKKTCLSCRTTWTLDLFDTDFCHKCGSELVELREASQSELPKVKA